MAPQPVQLSEDRRQALDAEYQATVQMFVYESQLFWAIMGVYLVVETLLTALQFSNDLPEPVAVFRIGIAFAGLVISWLWFAAIRHSAAFNRLRVYQARQLERQLGYSLFLDGARFSHGERVTLDGEVHHLRGAAKWPGIKTSGTALAVLFGSLFAVLLGLEVLRAINCI